MFKSFLGGIHPKDGKQYTMDKAIEIPALPEQVVIPMGQHIGAPCTPTVKVGDHVKKGQLIGTSEAFMHANIHASLSGDVVKIDMMPHSGKITCPAIVIKSDGLDEWADGLPLNRDWKLMDTTMILDAIKQAGIVGLGGATFPAHIKLMPKKPVDVLIINGAECEPYLTADYRLMLEQTERIVTGIEILQKLLGVKKCFIGIEDNKPEAVEVLHKAFSNTNVEVVKLQTKYPQGAEKMLIKVLTNREVPCGGLPMDVGAVVQNVGTAAAIADAVVHGVPIIERVTTVSGDAIKEPKNLLLRVGMTFQAAIDYCGGFSEKPEKLLAGGPMMGMAQFTAEVPVMKGTSGILALKKETVESGQESPCIRCGRCVIACPMGLVPSMLSILSERHEFAQAKEEYGLFNCVECGCCTYTCPAKRNIVQYVKYAKAENQAQAAREKAKAAK